MRNACSRYPSIRPLLTLLLGAALLWGCAKQQEAPPPEPPEVTVAKPIQRDVVLYRDFTGQTHSVSAVDIRARVQGYLESMHFSPATFVNKGDLLFVIEQEPYEANVAVARAALESASAELKRAEADVLRGEKALETDAISQAEVSRMRAERDKAAASVKSASAALGQAELELSYTEIRSPISGRVGRNLVDVGNLVGAGEATLLTTVTSIDPIHVYFDVPELAVLRMLEERAANFRKEPSLDFSIGLGTEKGFPHQGRLDYIDNTVDPDTGTIQVRGVIPNDRGLLYPGLFARVRVPSGTQEKAVLVRERAIGTDLAGKYVLVVSDDNIVEQRYVELGQLEGDMRIITEGITPEDVYIVIGLQRARPGMPVTPMMETESGAKVRKAQGKAGPPPSSGASGGEKGDG